MKVALIFGTRPEAIKMAPIVLALRRRARTHPTIQPLVYVTGQHRHLLDQVLDLFDVKPDADLDVMEPNQRLPDLTARMLTGLHELLERDRPDLVLVHGDTTTAFAAALAAHYRQIPVGHVEAGLRTGQRYSPFPEEANRRLVDHLATWHFAPTAEAVANLRREGIPADCILQTGNTVIDALLLTLRRLDTAGQPRLLWACPDLAPALNGERRIVLVTSHRRENLGVGLTGICRALLELTRQFPDIDVVYPVHPNPRVRETVEAILKPRRTQARRTSEEMADSLACAAGLCAGRIHLLEPLDYDLFCYLMSVSHLILTDSGGIQEEAPALHKPVLVLRDTSERPEAVAAGAARVVGTDPRAIVSAAAQLLADPVAYQEMAQAGSPYGDGQAAERIVVCLAAQARARRVAA
jgi:UDP-N-acetylglucosamine 2-epimerase (non-hydrolysing)